MIKKHPITFVIEEAPRDPFDPEAGSYFRIVRRCGASKRVYGLHVSIEDALGQFDRMNFNVATREELQMVQGDLADEISGVHDALEAHAAQRRHHRS